MPEPRWGSPSQVGSAENCLLLPQMLTPEHPLPKPVHVHLIHLHRGRLIQQGLYQLWERVKLSLGAAALPLCPPPARLIPLPERSSHHSTLREGSVTTDQCPPTLASAGILEAISEGGGLAQPSLWPPPLPRRKQQESWLKAEKEPGLATLPAELRDRLGAGMGRVGASVVWPSLWSCKPCQRSPREDLNRLFQNFECIFSTLGPRNGGSEREQGLAQGHSGR